MTTQIKTAEKILAHIEGLAAKARPINYADEKSKRQTHREMFFFDTLDVNFPDTFATDDFEDWCNRVGPDERIDEAMSLLKAEDCRVIRDLLASGVTFKIVRKI